MFHHSFSFRLAVVEMHIAGWASDAPATEDVHPVGLPGCAVLVAWGGSYASSEQLMPLVGLVQLDWKCHNNWEKCRKFLVSEIEKMFFSRGNSTLNV